MSIRSLMFRMAGLLWLGVVPVAAQGVASTVQLTVTSPLTLYYGQNVDGYANVAAGDGTTLAGTITFYDGATSICVISVANAATCPATTGSGFVAGIHVLTAVYSGDTTHSGATSNAVTVTVLPDLTAVSINSSVNPAAFGQSVVFTATAQGAHGTIAGTVVFFDGSTAIGSAVLNSSGVATISTAALAAGTHPITATYGATQNFEAAASAALSEVIQPAPTPVATTTMLASSANPSVSGQSVTFTVTVATAGKVKTPTGLVSILDGSTALWAGMLDASGSASFNTAALGIGTHHLTANYGGDAALAGSASAAMAQAVNAAPTGTGSFTIEVAPVTVVVGKMATIPVKVIPANGFNQAVQLGCNNLPSESACTFAAGMIPAGGGSTTLQLSTMGPHDCGSTTPYNAGLPLAGPAVAGLLILLVPGRRRGMMRMLAALVALGGFTAMSGCGNCTDLGTKPGTYTFNVTGTATGAASTVVSQKVTLTVTFSLL
jgi:Bacterial Ig-like domain (group 3)